MFTIATTSTSYILGDAFTVAVVALVDDGLVVHNVLLLLLLLLFLLLLLLHGGVTFGID